MLKYFAYFVLLTKISLIVAKMNPNILHGDFVTIKTFPHSVFLDVNCEGEYFICGASLVNQNFILTAAHCLSDCRRNWKIDAYAGQAVIEKMRVRRSVDRFKVHPDYDEDVVINDIGLAYVKPHFTLGSSIKRVILMESYYKAEFANVAGWGIVNERTNEDAIRLKSAKQKIVKPSQCSKLGRLERGRFCASWVDSKSRPSSGDSGSALVTDDSIQIGLVSFKVDQVPNLVAYTNVSYYYNWIKRNSVKMLCG